MDIKVIAGILGIAISLGSLFVFQGQLIQRVEVLESKSVPDITPLEKELSILKSQMPNWQKRQQMPKRQKMKRLKRKK